MSCTYIRDGKYFTTVSADEMELVRGKTIATDDREVYLHTDLPIAGENVIGPFDDRKEAFEAQKKLAEVFSKWLEVDREAMWFYTNTEE